MKNLNTRIYAVLLFFVFVIILLLFTNIKSSVMKILHIKTDETIIAEQQTTIHNLANTNKEITNNLQQTIKTNQTNIELLKKTYHKKEKINQVSKLDVNKVITQVKTQVRYTKPNVTTIKNSQPVKKVTTHKKAKDNNSYIVDKTESYVLGNIIYNKISTTFQQLTRKDKE